MLKDKHVLVKGAGDFASGSIRRLHLAGANVVCTELQHPLTIRRTAAFSEAIYSGEHTVEGVTAQRAASGEIDKYHSEGKVPVLADPDAKILNERDFDIVIDGRMAKKNLGTNISDAPIVVALGPGFEAGFDCHAVVETLAGHSLGRVIYKGEAAENTGVPVPTDLIPSCNAGFEPCSAGFDLDVNLLVLRAPDNGKFFSGINIGDLVKTGDLLGRVNNVDVVATADGVLRGLIHDGVEVTKGLKIGDIDPSGDIDRVKHISEKANAIAGGVLEATLYLLNEQMNID